MKNLNQSEKVGVWVALIVIVLVFVAIMFTGNQSERFQGNDSLNPDLSLSVLPGERNDSLSKGGLIVNDVLVGSGQQAEDGDVLVVHYRGTLSDGTQFDSSLDSGQPFSFELGAGQVIDGWDAGIIGMREGGVRVLSIPPEMAYGSQQTGPIPPNSTLNFEVQLLGVEKAGQQTPAS